MDSEEVNFTVSGRFEMAIYFTVAIWTWWWHGKDFSPKLLFVPKEK